VRGKKRRVPSGLLLRVVCVLHVGEEPSQGKERCARALRSVGSRPERWRTMVRLKERRRLLVAATAAKSGARRAASLRLGIVSRHDTFLLRD